MFPKNLQNVDTIIYKNKAINYKDRQVKYNVKILYTTAC